MLKYRKYIWKIYFELISINIISIVDYDFIICLQEINFALFL